MEPSKVHRVARSSWQYHRMTDTPSRGSLPSWTRLQTELRLGHTDEKSRSRDPSGLNGRSFDPIWYWGGLVVPALEAIVDLALYFVGQSTINSTLERSALLVNRVDAETPRW